MMNLRLKYKMNLRLKTNDFSSWYSAALDEYLSLHPNLELWELADPERLVIVLNSKFNFNIYTERTRKLWNDRCFCFSFYLRNIVQLLQLNISKKIRDRF